MAKRFTDTDIWEQDWFIDLPNKYKLLWNYIKDKCDNVGIWRPNKGMLQTILGESLNLTEFLATINDDKTRILVLPNGRWLITGFFVFQYGEDFKPKSHVHHGALKQLVGNGFHIRDIPGMKCGKLQELDFEELKEIAYVKGIDRLSIAYAKGSDRVKDKDKDKDKDIDAILGDIVLDTKQRRVISLLIEKGLLNEEDSETHKNKTIMLIDEMLAVYQKHKPGYCDTMEVDYPALLQIAYAIAKRKKWSRSEVVGERKGDVVASWERICLFIKNSEVQFLQSLTIDGISNPKNFQRIEEDMRVSAESGLKKAKTKSGHLNTGIINQDMYDN